MVAIATGLCLLPPVLRLNAQQKHKGHPAEKHKVRRDFQTSDRPVKHPSTHHAKPQASKHSYGHERALRRSHYHRRSRHHHHLPLVHLQPERVKEIQQALISAGFMQGEPTGQWDAATRAAMQHYQEANGFDATGLPEAKPLMKLGLGPHPLPPALAATPQAASGLQSQATASPNTAPQERVFSGQAQ